MIGTLREFIRSMVRMASVQIILLGILVPAAAAIGSESEIAVTRGLTGHLVVVSEYGFVRAESDGRYISELEFIGTDVGQFDLREVLVFDDGGPIDRLGPQMVEIVSNLSINAPSDVFLAEAPPVTIGGGYRAVLVLIAIAWILVPVMVVLRRLWRRPPPPAQVIPPPTIAQKIAPLVEMAATRELTVAEQGRLELLLYAHWQEQLGLGLDRVQAVSQLRRHAVAGQLLRAVEAWLHAPQRTHPSKREIADLLAPYLTPEPETHA